MTAPSFDTLILGRCGHQWWVPTDHTLSREEREFERLRPCPVCPNPEPLVESMIDFDCPDCGGAGGQMVQVGPSDWDGEQCYRCKGTGRVEFLDPQDADDPNPPVQRIVPILRRCSMCNGSGMVQRDILEADWCPTCNGTGHISDPT